MRGSRVLGLMMLVGGCAKAVQVPSAAQQAERYRPSWTVSLPLHLDGARACLDGREEPRFVAYVEPLSTGAVGFTTIDAFGAVENCAFNNGRVLRREPSSTGARELVGLPFFALGAEPPTLPVGQLAEEVFENDHAVGWLFWPSKQEDGGER